MPKTKFFAIIAAVLALLVVLPFAAWVVIGVHAQSAYHDIIERDIPVVIDTKTIGDSYSFATQRYTSDIKNRWLIEINGTIKQANGVFEYSEITVVFAGEENKFLSWFSDEGPFMDYFAVSIDLQNQIITHATHEYGNARGLTHYYYYPLSIAEDVLALTAGDFLAAYSTENEVDAKSFDFKISEKKIRIEPNI